MARKAFYLSATRLALIFNQRNGGSSSLRHGDEARRIIGDRHSRCQCVLFLALPEEESPAVSLPHRRVLRHSRRLQSQRYCCSALELLIMTWKFCSSEEFNSLITYCDLKFCC